MNKGVILAGGLGSRMGERTQYTPKPMIPINGIPMMVYVMKTLVENGIHHIYIAGGHAIQSIVDYLIENTQSTIQKTKDTLTVDLVTPLVTCRVTLVDTGEGTMTAQRIRALANHVKDDFVLAYGDTLADVDLKEGYRISNETGRLVTLCGVPYVQTFGLMEVDGNQVCSFKEKEVSKTHFINCGYMVVKKEIFNAIKEEDQDFSKDTLERLSRENQCSVYIHKGYWKAVDNEVDLFAIEQHVKEEVNNGK